MPKMYEMFSTDGSLEQNGIYLEYPELGFRIKVARAGGANKKFQRVLETRSKPYKRAISMGLFTNDQATDLLLEAYLDAVILGWEVAGTSEDEWTPGIENPEDGPPLEPTRANIRAALKALPELFNDVQDQAAQAAMFRTSIREANAGN